MWKEARAELLEWVVVLGTAWLLLRLVALLAYLR